MKNNNINTSKLITSKPLRVFLSFIISLVLIMDNSPRAFSFGLDHGADIETGNPVNELNIDTFTIPVHLGDIKRKFTGDSGNIVIHIQDAHCNKFAQGKISEILDFLSKEYGLKTINLEGGTGPYDLKTFTRIPSAEVRRDVAEHYLEKGDINGAEFFAINNPGETELWGVEDKELYLANLKVYRDSLGYRGEVDKYIDELTYILFNLKRRVFGEKLLELDEAYAAYKAGTRDLRSYLDLLVKMGGANGIDTAGFKNISSLMRSVSMEGGINFDKANKEKEVLVDELKKSLSKYDKEELVAKVLDFRTKKISMKGFYGYLIEKGRKCGVEKGRFSMLEKYLEYVTCYENVDVSAVMKEVDSLENAIKEKLFENDAQRELSLLSKDLALLKNIFSISITKEDYGYYLAAKDGFAVRRYLDFLEKNAPLYKIQARPSPGIERLDSHREEIGAFFEYSFKRDDAFMRNMKFVECPGGKKAAVVMTGGFHTDNLADLFKGQGLSYVSIIPKFKNEDGYESPYFALLAGERADSFSEALRPILAQASAMQVASKLSSLGDSVWGDIEMEAFRGAVHIREIIEKEKKARGREDIRVRLVRRAPDGSIIDVKNNDEQPVVFDSSDNMKEDSPVIELAIDELVQNVITYEIISASPEVLGQILSGSVAPEDVQVETATALSPDIMDRLSGKSAKGGEKASGDEKGKTEVLNFVAVTDGKGKVRIVFGPENSTSHALLKEKGFKGVDTRKVWYGTLSAAGVTAKPQGEMSAEERAKDEKLIKDAFKARGFQNNRTVQLKDQETVVFFVDPVTGRVFSKEDRTGRHANVLNQIKTEYKNGINALLRDEVPDPVEAEILVRINGETGNSIYSVQDGQVNRTMEKRQLEDVLLSIDGYFEHGSDILFRVFAGGYESEGEDGAKTEEKISTTQQFADQEELDTFAMYKPSLYVAFLRYLKKAGIKLFASNRKLADGSLNDFAPVPMLRKEVYDELKEDGDLPLKRDMDVVQLTSPFARKKFRASLGNKGAMLGDTMYKAGSVKELAGLKIPEGFILTTNMYRKWLNSGRKISALEEMKKQIKFNLAFIYLQTQANRAGEVKGNVQLTFEATKIAGTMGDDFGGWADFKVSVRSSPAASAPGKFDTVAGKQTLNEVFEAIDTVFNSWHDRVEGDKNKAIGMGIVVQRMVTGDAQAVDSAKNKIPREVEQDGKMRSNPAYVPDSFTGVFFTQNIDNGRADQISGNVKIEADGKKVVAGIDGGVPIQYFQDDRIGNPAWRRQLEEKDGGRELANFLARNKAVYDELYKYGKALEKEYGYPQDIEFTVENGALYILQVREAKTTPRNTIKFLKNMVERKDGKAMSEREAFKRAVPVLKQLNQKDVKAEDNIPANVARSFPEAFSVGGAATGKLVFCDNKGEGDEEVWAEVKRKIEMHGEEEVILVARVADIPDYIYDMVGGILTLYGGGSSHAAVNTRMRNLPSIIGMFNGEVEKEFGETLDIGDTIFREGAEMTFDSEGAKVFNKPVSLEDNGIKRDINELTDLGTIFDEVDKLDKKAPGEGDVIGVKRGPRADIVQESGKWSRMEGTDMPIWKCRSANGRTLFVVAKGAEAAGNDPGSIEELIKKRGAGFIKVVLFADGLVLNLGGDIMHDEISENISGSSGTPYVAGVVTSRNGKFNGIMMQEMRNGYDNNKEGHGVVDGILETLNSEEFNVGGLFEDTRLACAGNKVGGEKSGKIVRGEGRRLVLEEAVTQKAIVKNFSDAELEAWRVERTGMAGASLIDVKLAIEAIGNENEPASADTAMEKFLENGSTIRDYLISQGLLAEDPGPAAASLSPVKSEIDKIPDLLKKPLERDGFGICRSKVVNRDKYVLGDPNMLAIDIVNYLNAIDKEKGEGSTLLAEYILHEALERTGLGHYEIILLTSVIFGRTVSIDGEPEPYSPATLAAKLKDRAWVDVTLRRLNMENGGVETDLGHALRSFISASAFLQESPDLDKMTATELERKEEELAPEKDASTKLRVVSAKINAARARAVLGQVAPGKHLDIVLIPIKKDQLFFDGTSYVKLNSDNARTIQKEYGVNVRAIYYAIGDTDSFNEASGKAAEMMRADDVKARLLIYEDQTPDEGGNIPKKVEVPREAKELIGGRLTGVVTGYFSPEVETQRFSVVMLVTLGLGLNEANRDPDKAGTLKDAIIPLMKRMANNEEEIDRFMSESKGDLNEFLKKLYAGEILLDIKKINYEEIRDFMESEAEVLQSL